MLLHMCIRVCLCIHIAHYIRGDRLTDYLSIVTCAHEQFLHEQFLQFGFSALPCLTIAVRQCGRHTISIACFTAKLW